MGRVVFVLVARSRRDLDEDDEFLAVHGARDYTRRPATATAGVSGRWLPLRPTKASLGVLACPLELPQTYHRCGPRAVDLCAIQLKTLAVIASRGLELLEAIR